MMPTLAAWLLAASAAVMLVLGIVHLLYTFRGRKLYPRDADLEARMRLVPLHISRKTTMWNAWIGFNASHAFGLMFFGVLYGYLSLAAGEALLATPFLLCLGLVLLLGYAFLCRRFWFSAPLRWIGVAAALYAAALVSRFLIGD
jgi:hypothetical protein